MAWEEWLLKYRKKWTLIWCNNYLSKIVKISTSVFPWFCRRHDWSECWIYLPFRTQEDINKSRENQCWYIGKYHNICVPHLPAYGQIYMKFGCNGWSTIGLKGDRQQGKRRILSLWIIALFLRYIPIHDSHLLILCINRLCLRIPKHMQFRLLWIIFFSFTKFYRTQW